MIAFPPPILFALSGFVGALVGVIESFVVNLALVEISLSEFFALYFGILFVLVGGLILGRVVGQQQLTAVSSASFERRQFSLKNTIEQINALSFQKDPQKTALAVFAALIMLSGILCLVLNKDLFWQLPHVVKVPLYAILGISVSFALTFSAVDLLNYLVGFARHNVAKPLVESQRQVILIIGLSVAMGLLFGLIFGAAGVEEQKAAQLRVALRREENFCLPIGLVLGAVGGSASEWIRQHEHGYAHLQTDFDDEI